jgi:hypothetical protein
MEWRSSTTHPSEISLSHMAKGRSVAFGEMAVGPDTPASYTGIERDEAACMARSYLKGPNQRSLVGDAGETGLPGSSATAVYGEATLTTQSPPKNI